MDYEVNDQILFESVESFSATIIDKVASRIYYAQRVDRSQVVLYGFSNKASAIFFTDMFKSIENPAFKNNYVLGSIQSSWFVKTELPISYTFHSWVASITKPFVMSPYVYGPIDIVDEVKIVLRVVAEALWELLQMGFSYGVPLHTIRISPDGKPFMLAAFRPHDDHCILEDIDQYYTIVRDILSDKGDIPEVVYNFGILYLKSRPFYCKREFAHYFYQNPLIFTKSDQVKYIRDADLALFKNPDITANYLTLDNTSMRGWPNQIPPSEIVFLHQYNHPKNPKAYNKTNSFVRFRRNIGEHIEGPITTTRLEVEERWHLIFPQSCFVVFNAVMDLLHLDSRGLVPNYISIHIRALVDKSQPVS